MDAFQGYYKDGRDKTETAASSIHLILIFLIIACRNVKLGHYVRGYELNYTQLYPAAGTLFYALARPCRQDRANIIH